MHREDPNVFLENLNMLKIKWVSLLIDRMQCTHI